MLCERDKAKSTWNYYICIKFWEHCCISQNSVHWMDHTSVILYLVQLHFSIGNTISRKAEQKAEWLYHCLVHQYLNIPTNGMQWEAEFYKGYWKGTMRALFAFRRRSFKTFLTSFLGWSHTLMQAILYTIPMAPLDLSSHLALMRGQLFPAIHLPLTPHGAWRQFLLDKNEQRFWFSQVVGFEVRIPNMWI